MDSVDPAMNHFSSKKAMKSKAKDAASVWAVIVAFIDEPLS